MTTLTADALITATEILAQPLLFVEDGRVTRVTTLSETAAPHGTHVFRGYTLSAGFFDVHVHGAGGSDVMAGTPDALQRVGATLARYGTTSYLATTVTTTVEATLQGLDGIARTMDRPAFPGAAMPVGIHLEGPFLSHAKRGVHPAAQLQPPSISLFDRFWQAAQGTVRLLTIAPELPGALELIAHARGLGVQVSMGHSNALAAEARAGISAGATSATHTFNAMRPLDHREPGVLGVVLDAESLYAELICDGIHTTPEAVRLWWRMKGEERALLVTDGMAATGMPDGRYKLGDLDVDVANGTCSSGGVLAGSVLTMDRAVANMQRFTGVHLATAVRLATRNPSRMLGMAGGEVAVGSEANLNLFDADGHFAGSIVRGQLPAFTG